MMAISKIVFASFLSTIPNSVIKKVEEIQKDFLWNGKRPKVSHDVLVSDYQDGGLRSVDVRSKIIALRISWIRRLYTGSDHPWKTIPLHLINIAYPHGAFFPHVVSKPPQHLPGFYRNILKQWSDLRANVSLGNPKSGDLE